MGHTVGTSEGPLDTGTVQEVIRGTFDSKVDSGIRISTNMDAKIEETMAV